MGFISSCLVFVCVFLLLLYVLNNCSGVENVDFACMGDDETRRMDLVSGRGLALICLLLKNHREEEKRRERKALTLQTILVYNT